MLDGERRTIQPIGKQHVSMHVATIDAHSIAIERREGEISRTRLWTGSRQHEHLQHVRQAIAAPISDRYGSMW
jgi:hypothetical protein